MPAPPVLAEHPALDFLNTRPGLLGDVPVEHLPDGPALLEWLGVAGLLTEEELARIRARFSGAELDRVAAGARAYREQLRPVVARWASNGALVAPKPLAILNRLLAAGGELRSLQVVGGRLVGTTRRRFETPDSLLSPVASAFARLLVDGDRSLVRICAAENCSLWFYDRTKSHRRRWCSMAICGTRAKVAAYRARTRRDRSD